MEAANIEKIVARNQIRHQHQLYITEISSRNLFSSQVMFKAQCSLQEIHLQ